MPYRHGSEGPGSHYRVVSRGQVLEGESSGKQDVCFEGSGRAPRQERGKSSYGGSGRGRRKSDCPVRGRGSGRGEHSGTDVLKRQVWRRTYGDSSGGEGPGDFGKGGESSKRQYDLNPWRV